MKKTAYCKFDPTFDLEKSVGALRIYLPANIGYINFNIAHCIYAERVCDTWRISKAFAVDDQLENPYVLTHTAEWEMALRIEGRDDFIGGYVHGDEIFTDIRLLVDGCERQITSLSELTGFGSLRLQVESIGYDPADHETKALKHIKEYIIDSHGISVEQKVQWLNDYELNKCYLAMMPPLKTVTDSVYTDVDKTVKKLVANNCLVENCRSATLFGTESKLSFTMSVPKYPFNEIGNLFAVSDNGGLAYNKMYFYACKSGIVKAGEVWESRTHYTIQNG